MSDIISLCNYCSSYSANTTNWKYLINIIKIVNWNLLYWRSWPIKNYVVIVDFYCISLRISLFWSCSLRWFKFKELLKVLEAGGEKLFFENSRSEGEGTYISYVIFSQVLIHVFIDSSCVDIVRKDGELGWEDKILLLRCWEWSRNWGWWSISWKCIAQWTDDRSRSFSVNFTSNELSKHEVFIHVWN